MIRKVMVLGALAVGTLLLGTALASSSASKISSDDALNKLMEGNRRYIENNMVGAKSCDLEARKKLSTSQAPFAIILSCSDSRVPPELLFDEGLGEIFVVRVAGNVVDPVILGSIEYAAEHLGTPLVMVLGHERCGAVKATVDSNGKGEGNIGSIVKAIAPALKSAKSAKKHAAQEKAEFVETVVNENIKLVKGNLTKQSKVLSHLVKEGKLKVVAAKYDLDDGTVTLMDR